MVICGKEVNFKISNKKHAARLGNALKTLEKGEEKVRSMDTKDLFEILDVFIGIFRKFFIDATGVDVLENCEDAEEAKEAYLQFITDVNEQKKKFLSPYSLDRIK